MELNNIISSGILELYVLGKTTEQETQQVLVWKAQYPEVAQELSDIEDSLEQLDFANALTPTLDTKKKIFENILGDNTLLRNEENSAKVISLANNTPQQKNYFKYATAASVALLIASALYNMNTFSKYAKVNDELASALQKNEISNKSLADLQTKLEVPLNNYSQAVTLKGTATAPNSTAKIFWIKNTNEVYVEPSGLPQAPKGFQYQLWAIVDGKPVDGGMIIINDGQKYNLQKMKSFGKAQAFAITLEKAGGSSTPTMEKMYVMSTI